MEKAMLVNGAPTVQLIASSSAVETKWVAYLVDEAPDGSWEWISHGYADSHLWGDEAVWAEMKPGTEYQWDMTLFPTAVVVEKGHSIAMVIASQDSGAISTSDHCFSDYRGGCYNPTGILPSDTAGQATNTIHLGEDGTWVEISLVDPTLTQKAATPPKTD
jgi:predicted acyl esterase